MEGHHRLARRERARVGPSIPGRTMSRKRQETGHRGGEREEDISLVGSRVSVVLETLGSVAATARPGPPRRRACPDSNRPSGARQLRTGCMTPSRARPGPDRYPCCDRGTRRSRGRRRPPRSGNELRQIRQVLREQLDVDEQVAAVTARAAYKMRRLGNRHRRTWDGGVASAPSDRYARTIGARVRFLLTFQPSGTFRAWDLKCSIPTVASSRPHATASDCGPYPHMAYRPVPLRTG